MSLISLLVVLILYTNGC